MRHTIIALALVLVPVACYAGDPRLLFLASSVQCQPQTGTVSTLNGVSQVIYGYEYGPFDTGTGTPSANPVCSGTATISASCSGDSGTADVNLEINGTVAATLHCNNLETKAGQTLSATVNGRYSARIYSVVTGNSLTGTSNFSFPVAQ